MARDKSPAQRRIVDAVKSAVTSVLKPTGFRKTAFNFHRRHKFVVQVVKSAECQSTLGRRPQGARRRIRVMKSKHECD